MANFTKKAIRDSFVKLLNEKPMSQITVRDIVDDCGVNRNTFYYYYQDLPQLLESIVNEEADRIIGEYPSAASVNRDIYEKYQWRVCYHGVTTYVDGILTGRKLGEEDRQLLIDYAACVCFGFSIGWLESGMKDDILTRFHRLCQLKQGDVERMIVRCEEEA